MKNRYFLISDNFNSAKFTAFVSFGFDYETEHVCQSCGATRIKGIFKERIELVKKPQLKWPDIMFSIGLNSIVISEKVVLDMTRHGITGWRAHPLHLEGSEIKLAVVPKYFSIEPATTIPTRHVLLPIHQGLVCPACGMWDKRMFNQKKIRISDVILNDYPNNSPDWVLASHGDNLHVLCSDAVIGLAHSCKWTNFLFRPFGRLDIWRAIIRHENKNWRELLDKDCEMLLSEAQNKQQP